MESLLKIIGASKHEQAPSRASLQAIAASEEFNKRGLVAAHSRESSRAAAENRKIPASKSSSIMFPSFLAIDSFKTPRPIDELLPIQFPELRLSHIHRGYFLTGRICVPSFRCDSSSITTILEDEQGKGIKVNIQIDDDHGEEGEDYYHDHVPLGALIAVKEPFFRRFGDGTVGVWINNPQDNIVFLSTTSPTSSSSSSQTGYAEIGNWTIFGGDYAQLRVRGNLLFSKGDLDGAIALYSKSIVAAEKELDKIVVKKQRDNVLSEFTGELKKTGEFKPSSKTGKFADTGEAGKVTGGFTSSGTRYAGFLHSCLIKLSRNLCSSKEPTIITTAIGVTGIEHGTPASHEAEPDQYKKQVVIEALISAYSNRSEARLRIKSYKDAFDDSRKALELEPSHVKSVYRKGRSLHSMGMYREAVVCFRRAARLAPEDAELKQAVEEGVTSEKQSRGIFDLSQYFESGFSGKVPRCADFVGPVRVWISGISGRGLFVTKDVKAGELLLVSNPMAISRSTSSEGETDGDASMEDLACQLWEATKGSWNRGRLNRQLNYLLGGSKQGELPDEGLQFPETLASLSQPHDEDEQVPDLTRDQLWAILQSNTFDEQGFSKTRTEGESQTCSGLWFLPSFINHSCVPNVSRIHIGDAMFIRASRDIKAGDEILHPYTDIICPSSIRREALQTGWGFVCHCQRCKLEAKFEKKLEGAVELYSDLEDISGTASSSRSCLELIQNGGNLEDILASRSWAEYFSAQCVREMGNVEGCVAGVRKLEERMWMRASFLLLYLMVSATSPPRVVLDGIVQAVASVSPGDPQVLKLAAVIGGEKSAALVSRLCAAIFGDGYSPAVLRACTGGAIC